MNTLLEPHTSLPATARHALHDIKDVTQHSLLEPLAQGTREVAETAKSGCHALAESTNYELERMEVWAIQHPVRTLGVSFAAGLVVGIVLFQR